MTTIRTPAFVFTLAGLALVSCTAPAAHAGGIVTDGGFEAATVGSAAAPGSLGDGWIVTQGAVDVFSTSSYANTGSKSLDLNYAFAVNSITQTLATISGQKYTVSFYAASDDTAASPDPFALLFGGQTLTSQPISGTGLGKYTFYSYTATATAATTDLTFQGQYGGPTATDGTFIDDVSVVPAGTPAVPEASTTVSLGLLLALGAGGIMIAARRKKGASSL